MLNADGNKDMHNLISGMWNNYVNLETFMEDEVKQRENDMQEEYEYWSKVKPKLIKDANGKYTISGLKLNK